MSTIYLGFNIDNVTFKINKKNLVQGNVTFNINTTSSFRVLRNVTALSTMCLLGLMAAANPVVPLGLLLMRRLQRWFAHQRLDPVRHKLRVLLLPRSVSPGPQDRGLLPQSTSAQRPSLVLQLFKLAVDGGPSFHVAQK